MTSAKPRAARDVIVINEQPSAPEPPSPRPWLWVVLAGAIALVLILAIQGDTNDSAAVTPISPTIPATPPSLATNPLLEARGPAFGEESGVVLVFDDGLDGLLIVDPDTRIATRRSAGLQRQSRRTQLDQVGDALVVGGGLHQVLSLSTRDVTPIPPASYHLVAPDGSLWLVDLRSGDQPVPIPALTKVTLEGDVLVASTETPIRGIPTAAVANEILLGTAEGLYLWDPVTGDVRQLTPDRGALVLGAWGPQLAWCPHECTTVIIENVSASSRTDVPIPDGLGEVDHTTAKWSPRGDQLAVVTTEAVVAITDLEAEPVVTVLTEYAIGAGAPRFVAWDPSGDYVYFGTDSPQGRLMGLWRSDGTRLGTGTTTLPFAGASGPFVVLNRDRGAWMVGESMGDYADCPAPSTVQMPEPDVCSFRF